MIAPLSSLPKGYTTPSHITAANIEMKRFILEEGLRKYTVELNGFIQASGIRFPAHETLPGGLLAIPEGLERLKRGDMAGNKIDYFFVKF
jgi:hypothetical protein